MAGRPGTVRFGDYGEEHKGKPDANGRDELTLQFDGPFTEQHYLYNPTQRARAMGSTLGDKPGDMAGYEKRLYEAPSNHDGFEGGDGHLLNLDERKVLDNTIYAVSCVYADDFQHNFSSDERTA